ncbi:MAG TPA: glycoside hydrolase family 3 N-terminal domain-containing protein [Ignavibacteriaceae bacterium]|nr:glycoside hydrolase family 3 N-terminal domain-containing protein [Ignavibacteriaceae bacterium]
MKKNKGEEDVIDKPSRGTRKVIELSEEDELWVNKTLESMTLYDKCAQIFMPAVFGKTLDQQSKEFQFALEMVKIHGIGGVVISTGDVEETASMIAELQKNSKIPLLVSADFENGIGMRMKASNTFPHNMALGSTYNPDFAYETGKATAIEALMLGVNINLAPVADVNSNPENPVINLRSFSEDKDVVTEFCLSFVEGSLEGGVVPIAKHFPGHGNTKTDSHIDMPVIKGSKEILMENELKPFISLIENKVPAIMTGHLNVPAFESDNKIPASLSYNIITKLLKEQLGFKGLIMTDALDMKAVTNYYSNSEACVMAFKAGNDILLMPPSIRDGITSIYDAVKSGKISEERLNESVKKILTLKRWLKLDTKNYKQETDLPKRIRLEEHYHLSKIIAENSITIVKADKELLPIDSSKYLKMFIVDITNRKNIKDSHFSQIVHESFSVYSHISLTSESNSSDYKLALDIAKDSDFIIVPAYFYIRSGVNGKTVSDVQFNFFRDFLALGKKVLIISFESPYLLSNFPDADNYICAFSDSKASQRAVLNVLNGTLVAKGKLPVSIPNTDFRVGYSWNPE